MSTYKRIIENLLNTKNNFFHSSYVDDKIDNVVRGFFMIFLTNSEINVRNKFAFFESTLGNFFIKGVKVQEIQQTQEIQEIQEIQETKPEKKAEFIHYFCKIQKTYHILNRLIYNYKYRKARILVNTDMALNDLTPGDKNVMCVFDNGAKYLFHIGDLIKIANVALTNSHMFFAEPFSIKNPYNNIAFNKSTLYNIYFFIRFRTDIYTELFFDYFRCDFNLSNFKKRHEYKLREYSIKNFVYKSPAPTLAYEISMMIESHNRYCVRRGIPNKIYFDKEFPRDRLIKIMQPYLFLYYRSEFSLLHHERKDALYHLRKGLIEFSNYNKQFGRKKYKIVLKMTENFEKKVCGRITEFDERHLPFNNKEQENRHFLRDHLEVRENVVLAYLYPIIINYAEREEAESEEEEAAEAGREEAAEAGGEEAGGEFAN